MGTILILAETRTLPHTMDEILAVQNSIEDVYTITGDDVERDLLHAIGSGALSKVVGVWIALHGNDEGFHLGNSFLEKNAFVQYLASINPSWIFMNSCDSERLVSFIQDRIVDVSVIAINGDVKDRDAWRTGRLFALAYRKFGSAKAAIEIASPGQGVYHYWAAPNGNDKSTSAIITEMAQALFGDGKADMGVVQDVKTLKEILREWPAIRAKVDIQSYILTVLFITVAAVLSIIAHGVLGV